MKAIRTLLIAGLLLITHNVLAESLLIAAGAGYKRPVSEISAAFEKKTGTRVEQIYGHMAGIVSQAQQSEQVAVIFGDHAYLAKVDRLSFSGFVPLGEGRLVVAWPKGGELASPAALADKRYARIAIPDAKAAIFGIAATEYLQRSGLAPTVAERLQVASTVPQVSAYLISGEVDAGFINLTEALAIKDKIGGYLEIDAALYSPIRIVGGVIRGFEDKTTVKSLQQFLVTPEAAAILKRYGL